MKLAYLIPRWRNSPRAWMSLRSAALAVSGANSSMRLMSIEEKKVFMAMVPEGLGRVDEGYGFVAGAERVVGSHKVTEVPVPTADVKWILPPRSSMTSLTMAMPRPVPGMLPEVSAR